MKPKGVSVPQFALRPILDLQLPDSAEFSGIAGDQRGVVRQRSICDQQVVGADRLSLFLQIDPNAGSDFGFGAAKGQYSGDVGKRPQLFTALAGEVDLAMHTSSS